MLNTTKLLADPQLNVDAWNKQVQRGAFVIYLDDHGEAHLTRTRSDAEVLGGHTAVIWIEGRAGCVLLDRVTPTDE